MKNPLNNSSEAEQTLWVAIIVLFAVIGVTCYLLWTKASL